jgi:hypothetical protein
MTTAAFTTSALVRAIESRDAAAQNAPYARLCGSQP